ncbi:MAG TPA: type 1 glutamine amidotransferase domain-containing protein [Methanomassiliicoccales archaeon]|nr:type 1 glutamine amidotransferase domain-containing protein [Methanomassiliicoccales archaeon]HQQ25494.1 type 1 glutamine amidotransferase domain-containing protein [Methanomassiliicoccales archaeon]
MPEQRRKVAVLVEDDYEDLELWYPYFRLIEAGYEPVLIGPREGTYRGKRGYEAKVGLSADRADARDLLGLVIPGGWAPDRLRRHPSVVELVRSAFDRGAIIASICHGGSLLVSANVVRGRKVTSFHSIEVDLINAGARFMDREVVVDGNLITSRRPDDLPAFMRELLRALKGQRTKSD